MARQAILLAAGKGARLGENTRDTPKVMLTVGDRPVLAKNIELLKAAGVDDVFINLHHRAEVIQNYCGDGSRFGVAIHYRFEPELLGTSGAVKNFASDLRPAPFFVIYGDNFSNFDLNVLWEGHRQYRERSQAVATVGFYERPDVLQSGIAELDTAGRITRFIEKPRPEEVFSRLVNTGCYVAEPEILNWIPDGGSDFGRDIFPRLVGEQRLFGLRLEGWLRPIDTEPLWRQAQEGSSGKRPL